MSSHTRNLARWLRDVEKLKSIFRSNIQDEYSRGVYNGIELLSSLLWSREADLYLGNFNEAFHLDEQIHKLNNK